MSQAPGRLNCLMVNWMRSPGALLMSRFRYLCLKILSLSRWSRDQALVARADIGSDRDLAWNFRAGLNRWPRSRHFSPSLCLYLAAVKRFTSKPALAG